MSLATRTIIRCREQACSHNVGMPGEKEKPCIDAFAHATKTCHATLRREGKGMKHAPDATQVRRGPAVAAFLGLLS